MQHNVLKISVFTCKASHHGLSFILRNDHCKAHLRSCSNLEICYHPDQFAVHIQRLDLLHQHPEHHQSDIVAAEHMQEQSDLPWHRGAVDTVAADFGFEARDLLSEEMTVHQRPVAHVFAEIEAIERLYARHSHLQ